MNLAQKQRVFARLVAKLLTKANDLGFEVSIGEVWRPPETAQLYAKKGGGIANSLHCDKLAIDINLFKGDLWLRRTKDHAELGAWWEAQSTADYKCCWGGHFDDGNHYSIEHQGVR